MREVQIGLGELCQQLSDVVTRVTRGHERVVLMSGGQPTAAVIGVEDLRRLQAANDNSTASRLAPLLIVADRVREQIQQWQISHHIQYPDSVETLRELREARDAGFDDLR